MNALLKHAYYISLVAVLTVPAVVRAQLVPSCTEDCGLDEFIQLLENIMNFAILIAPLVAVIMFVWAGFVYVTSAGNPNKVSQAHTIFTNTLIGFVIVLAAWLVVKALLAGLGAQNFVTEFLNI